MTHFHLSLRSSIQVAVATTWMLALSGCASSLAALMHNELVANRQYFWDVQVLSTKPQYKVTSTSILYGEKTDKAESDNRLQILSRGHYRNWNWVVQAPPAVAVSWRVWQHNAHKIAAVAQANSSVPPTLNWENAIKRLYAMTRYLLGKPPLPIDANIRLVPNGEAYHSTLTVSAPSHVPLAVAAWYPVSSATAADAQEKRFRDFRKVLAVTAGLLQHVELVAGETAAPTTSSNARRIKNWANTFCWHIAGPPALAAGTALRVLKKFSDVNEDTSSGAVKLAAITFKQYPKDPQVARVYAGTLVFRGIQRYFRQRNIALPTHGNNIRKINAL